MPRRLVNLVLLAATVTLVASGLIAWLVPESTATPLYLVHRAAGLALVLAIVSKLPIARGSLLRRARQRLDLSLAVGIATAALLLVTLALGLGWTFGPLSFDRPWAYSALNLHVFAGLALAALVLWHLATRWERRPTLGRALSRRALLRVAGIGVTGAALVPILEPLADTRRPTGSKHAKSFSGNDFPLTTWTFDSVPAIDRDAYRLHLAGALARPAALSLDDLDRYDHGASVAVIDCTGGWWSEQRWTGVDLSALLARHGIALSARRVEVVSVTGHSWTFAPAELAGAVLATRVGGEPLSAGHGAPLRLVIPERRGFQWVKWIDRIEVS